MSPDAPNRMGPAEFAAEAVAAIQATGLVTNVWYDEPRFRVQYELGDARGWTNLGNHYAEFGQAAPAERARRWHAALQGLQRDSTTPDWHATKDQLRPVLRGAALGSELPQPAAMLCRDVVPYVREHVVIDNPTTMTFVSEDMLPTWGVTGDEVFATARANLIRGTNFAAAAEMTPTLIRLVDQGSDYFTSLPLCEGFLGGLFRGFGRRPVAFMPDRGSLLIGWEGSELSALYETVSQHYQAAQRSLSPVGYTVDNAGRMVPYVAPPGDPTLARAVNNAAIQLAAVEYSTQQERLRARYEEEDVDIFVASLMVYARPDGWYFSQTVWTSEIVTLLPIAEFVAFPLDESGEDIARVPFEVVARETGLTREPGFSPPRFEVGDHPEREVFARILEHRV
jgi:hypothetical protein